MRFSNIPLLNSHSLKIANVCNMRSHLETFFLCPRTPDTNMLHLSGRANTFCQKYQVAHALAWNRNLLRVQGRLWTKNSSEKDRFRQTFYQPTLPPLSSISRYIFVFNTYQIQHKIKNKIETKSNCTGWFTNPWTLMYHPVHRQMKKKSQTWGIRKK